MMVFENNIDYLLAFISAIFGLSVPLMLQVIERVDDKYKSTRLAERLKRESCVMFCGIALIVSLVTCTYALFVKLPSPWDCWIMNHSADLLAILSCVALMASFLFACLRILRYYNPERLQQDIIKAIENTEKDEVRHEKAVKDLVDLSKTILESSGREPALRIYDVLSSEIANHIDRAGDEGIQIPKYLAYGITSINENLCLMERRPYSVNNGNQLLKMLISSPAKLSENVYSLLWRNLTLQLYYNAEDWVYEYWTQAVQVYNFDLRDIYDGLSDIGEDKQYSAIDAEKRLEQRQRFQEFHIVLCAYIFHQKRYDLLDKLFWYTQSIPPEYPLIPSTLEEIIAIFHQLDKSPRWDVAVEQYYSFMDMKGIVDLEIKGIVKRYLSLLFLRLFSPMGIRLEESLVLPNKLGVLISYESYFNYIGDCILKLAEDEKILSLIRFDKSKALEIIKQNLESIKSKAETIRISGQLSDKLKKENLEELKNQVQRMLDQYKPLFEFEPLLDPDITYWINGNVSYPYQNTAFMEHSDMSYFGMADIVGEAVMGRFRHLLASVFYQVANGFSYRLNNTVIFEAIDRLGINSDFVIVSFDIYWDYYISGKQHSLIKKKPGVYSYKEIDIINLSSGSFSPVSQSFFVFKKVEGPEVVFLPPSEEQKKMYQLEELDPLYKLYSSIIQLSGNEEMLETVQKDLKNERLDDKALFSAFLIAKVHWSKHTPIVSIKLMYDLRDNGTSDDVSAVKRMYAGRNRSNNILHAEDLAMYKLGQELGVKLTRRSKGPDAEGEKDGKKIYLETKCNFKSNRTLDTLARMYEELKQQEEVFDFYVAVVSDTPLPEASKKLISERIKAIPGQICEKFYSFYKSDNRSIR